MTMCILHTVESLSTASGGSAQMVTSLCDALADEAELDVTLCSQIIPGETSVAPVPDSRVTRRLAPGNAGLWRRCGGPLSRLVTRTIAEEKPALIHDHGLWAPPHHAIAEACRKYGIPLVLHSHGMVESWALSWHAWRKKIAWNAWVRRDLQMVTLFMATAEHEVISIRRLGFRQPIACIANGVLLPDAETVACLRVSPPPVRVALFVGRIHPIKGLLNLIDAWQTARSPGWRLILAGPDEGGHRRQVEEKIRAHGLSADISWAGEVQGAEKMRLFATSDLFILPSFSENFGVVVAEALAYGLPVITTTGTPWREITEFGCGWWVEPRVDALVDALRQATAIPGSELRAMGERGRALARRYDWRTIAQQTAAVYRWLLQKDKRPDWVTVD